MAFQITATAPDPALLDLPWGLPLEDWPADVVAALPRGISRHVVRFVKLSGRVLAVKEISEWAAQHEYDILKALARLEVPCVTAVAVVTGRTTPAGEPLDATLVTQHLQFALPYRALFSQRLAPETAARLLDALAVLLVRLHLAGFYWGDVSLSNTLFRRDARAFAAYLVDAETGDWHKQLSPGQRAYDLDLARINIIGELMDLEAGDRLSDGLDAIETGDWLVERYESLWQTLTEEQVVGADAKWQVAQRIARLNQLGFDVAELDMTTDPSGTALRIAPKVVEPGHHARRLFRLTGLNVQENQARQLLNDLDAHRDKLDLGGDEEFAAHDWVTNVFEPTVRAVPAELGGKLERAQLFHEIQDHRWFMSERAGRSVPLAEAAEHYVTAILRNRRDEAALIGVAEEQLPPVPEL